MRGLLELATTATLFAHRAENQVREDRRIATGEPSPGSNSRLESGLQDGEGVWRLDLAHLLPNEHGGGVEQRDPLHFGPSPSTVAEEGGPRHWVSAGGRTSHRSEWSVGGRRRGARVERECLCAGLEQRGRDHRAEREHHSGPGERGGVAVHGGVSDAATGSGACEHP